MGIPEKKGLPIVPGSPIKHGGILYFVDHHCGRVKAQALTTGYLSTAIADDVELNSGIGFWFEQDDHIKEVINLMAGSGDTSGRNSSITSVAGGREPRLHAHSFYEIFNIF